MKDILRTSGCGFIIIANNPIIFAMIPISHFVKPSENTESQNSGKQSIKFTIINRTLIPDTKALSKIVITTTEKRS